MRLTTMIAGLVMSLAATAASAQANWTKPFAPFRVIDNVYYVGSEGLSAWLISTPKGLILLDVGMPANAELVEKNIRALGFQLKDVKILLNSHAHFDHSGGLAKLKADTGAELDASAGDKPALETGTYPGWESRKDFDFPPVKVDRVLNDGDKVSLGGVTLTVVATPGHSAGCTSYLLPVTDAGKKHTAFFFCSASVAANRLAPDPQYPGIVADYRKTFARLKTVDADIFLAPHAEMFGLAAKRAKLVAGQPNPFIQPGELQTVASAFETAFNAALAKQEASPK
jgi:metallo-beta-lactamase class B